MPCKSDKVTIINTQYDRRVKLTPEMKDEIRRVYDSEGVSIRELQRRYKVNRRLIQFILFPERKEQNLKCREQRGGWKQYYDRHSHCQAVKKTRHYKADLIKSGAISNEKD